MIIFLQNLPPISFHSSTIFGRSFIYAWAITVFYFWTLIHLLNVHSFFTKFLSYYFCLKASHNTPPSTAWNPVSLPCIQMPHSPAQTLVNFISPTPTLMYTLSYHTFSLPYDIIFAIYLLLRYENVFSILHIYQHKTYFIIIKEL